MSIRICTYSPPPPLFREEIAELVLRRVAYVPFLGIMPSRSSVCAVSVSYLFGEIASDVLVAVTITGSTTSSGFDFSRMSEAMGSGAFLFSTAVA